MTTQGHSKTRFAPSPTGYLHVGGLRTALYCYLFARKNKGKFALRIEDTDQERFVEGATENLIKILNYFGLTYEEGPILQNDKIVEQGDKGPYIQSKRTEIYKKYAEILLEEKHAYRCFCTKERLEEMRKKQEENKQAPMYDRKCLELPESEIREKLKAKESFVIRQKMPYESIKFKDLIRGNVQFDGKMIDDQILVKSDGFPTYHLANVVDDHLMEITHVIRGEEWLPSTPKHISLYKAFGWEPPEFAHLSLLLNPDKTKLSKRQGHVAVEEYISEGYIKEAIINFVAFLGWNPGEGEEKEIFTLKELEEIFDFKHVHKAGAIFNIEKLDWFNWKWQKKFHLDELEKIARETEETVVIETTQKDQKNFKFSSSANEEKFLKLRGEKLKNFCEKYMSEEIKKDPRLTKMLVTIEEKILREPKNINDNLDFYFNLTNYPKELLTHEKLGVDLNQAQTALGKALTALNNLKDWDLKTIEKTLFEIIEELKVKNGQVLWPLRSALSGLTFSPGTFEIAWALGKEETEKRIKTALEKI